MFPEGCRHLRVDRVVADLAETQRAGFSVLPAISAAYRIGRRPHGVVDEHAGGQGRRCEPAGSRARSIRKRVLTAISENRSFCSDFASGHNVLPVC